MFFYNRLRRPGFGGLIVGGLATAHNMVQMLRSQKDSLGLAIKGRLGTLSQKDGSTSLAPGTLSESRGTRLTPASLLSELYVLSL